MPSFSLFRAALVLLLIASGFGLLSGRVVQLQTYGREQTILRADRQQHQTQVLQARRGSIFDANGLLMAGTVQTQAVFVDPKFLYDAFQEQGRSLVELDQAIDKLAGIIDRDPMELSQILSDRQESRYVKLAEKLDQQACDAIRELDLPGVGLMPMHERYYPMGSLAAHVLGVVGAEGTGLEGVEMQYEKTLGGANGFKRSRKDSRGRSIAVAEEDYLAPQHGRHLVLTIDANIQMIAQQELGATCEQFRAKRGEAIVIDPRTGDVLAMANWPTFNPQNIEDSLPETRRNRCLTDPYEPGSTIKPFIMGPALAGGVTQPNEVWPIPGKSYKSRLRPKPIVDVYHYGPLATWDVLVKSSNIGMTMLGERMGKSRLFEALTGFNFGTRTGIDLPGEDPGRINPLKSWHDYSIPSVCQGYEVMVTPMQLARAFCVYANGGRLVKPRIVKGILDDAGQVESQDAPRPLASMPQVMDPTAALALRRILCDVPVRGTGTRARSRDYTIFGKTGTAHVSTGGAYNETSYTSSFVGGAPAENPRVVIAMVIHEPDRNWAIKNNLMYYGGTVAAPGAGKVLEQTLRYLQVPASPPLTPPPPAIASVLVRFDPKVYTRFPDPATASAH